MHWDRLFEDLEGQLASEWEAERASLDAESERVRISHLALGDRLRVLCAAAASATIHLSGQERMPVRLQTLGADWIAVRPADADRPALDIRIVPLGAIRGIECDHGMLLSSLEEQRSSPPSLRERMTLGFVLRDLARRRAAVRLSLVEGAEVHGTIDRAGIDHLDLALHDAGQARVASAVRGFRIIPFEALISVQVAAGQLP